MGAADDAEARGDFVERGPHGQFVVLKMEVQRMKHCVQTVLSEEASNVQAMVDKAVERYLQDGLARDVEQAVRQHTRSIIEGMVKSTLSAVLWEPEVRRTLEPLMAKAVKAAIKKELETQ